MNIDLSLNRVYWEYIQNKSWKRPKNDYLGSTQVPSIGARVIVPKIGTTNPIILGIETSCDETAISIIQDHESGIPKILSNIVSSQFDIHKEFGGVVPELAARSHVEKINIIARKAFKESGISLGKISAVASTVRKEPPAS